MVVIDYVFWFILWIIVTLEFFAFHPRFGVWVFAHYCCLLQYCVSKKTEKLYVFNLPFCSWISMFVICSFFFFARTILFKTGFVVFNYHSNVINFMIYLIAVNLDNKVRKLFFIFNQIHVKRSRVSLCVCHFKLAAFTKRVYKFTQYEMGLNLKVTTVFIPFSMGSVYCVVLKTFKILSLLS